VSRKCDLKMLGLGKIDQQQKIFVPGTLNGVLGILDFEVLVLFQNSVERESGF